MSLETCNDISVRPLRCPIVKNIKINKSYTTKDTEKHITISKTKVFPWSICGCIFSRLSANFPEDAHV